MNDTARRMAAMRGWPNGSDWLIWTVGAVVCLAISTIWVGPLAAVLAVWATLWAGNVFIASRTWGRYAAPIFFGLTLLLLWEMAVRLFSIPEVILPAPTQIAQAMAANAPILWADLVQTVFKGALSGWIIGCAAGIGTGLLVARSDFLRRGLLPVGNFMAALPIVGTAPILVMWFGFGWESKAAVVVVMVFFPVLVNTVAGLSDTTAMQRDLLHTYAATPGQGVRHLSIPAALPFIFNGLKIATTLALIGAIVAEFFGSPTVGMGFRISTEVGRLNLPLVWAEIVVAAVVGSLSYAAIAALEKRLTFWHPSLRARR
ncbi:ABC transporter permease [Jannaschia aquimarina]|uniref:SsuC_2 protein n=1 Tax=Jannaschia aquimarina TaxID=935700 RepID=A0A0D1EJ18_9RHOB|nr:ABC transporter permease [Jannaschia aquimarina]KIT16946.1 putative aliphatic sulfonates transport permease protein SsuC [Jannaschia aquimarina]SNT11015.1 NitT/TauT family transport system permease protein [Jannaschia aquimarina]